MMKKFFTVATMFALVVGFAACGGGDDEPTPTPPSTEQPGDNPTDDPTDDPTDQPSADAVKFVNRVTSASTGLTLAATHSFLEVSDEVAPVEVEFAVFNAEGQNITDAATVYVVEGNSSVRVADAKYTPAATGKYQFWASYKTQNTKSDALLEVVAVADMPETLADTNPSSTDFKHHALLIKATGVNCPNCPRATEGIHLFFEHSDYADNTVQMALHTYDDGHLLSSKGAITLTRQAGLGASYPAIKLNFKEFVPTLGSDEIANMLDEKISAICLNASETAIAVATSYNEETGAISVAAKVKCDEPNKYKVSAVLLQDNVYFYQQGAQKTEHHMHEAIVRAVAPATGVGYALNNGEETELGTTYDFCSEFAVSDLYSKGTGEHTLDVLRDARVIVYVQTADKVVDNVVSCGLNQKVGFLYNE